LNKFRLLFVQQHFPTIITHVNPGTFEFCIRIIRVFINIRIEITVEWNVISNISTSKRCNLQFTTWCVVPNEIFGPWMSRRGQGRCSNLVKNMLGGVVIWWKICWRPFREIPVHSKGRGQAGGGCYEMVSRKVSRKPYSLDHYKFKQRYALSFMFAKIRKQNLQSYSFHSRDLAQPLMSRCGEIRKKNISKLWILLRWGWVFLERTWILSGIQFTTYFMNPFVVETKRFVGSFVHVILTRQICGQRSSRAAESKRRAIGNYFSKRIAICS